KIRRGHPIRGRWPALAGRVGTTFSLCLTCPLNKSRMFPGFRARTHNLNPVGLNSPVLERLRMKLSKLAYVLLLGLMLGAVAPGCRKRPGYMTNIPAGKTPNIADNENNQPLAPNPPAETNGFALTDPSVRQNWPRNSEIFKAYTVHFDFD